MKQKLGQSLLNTRFKPTTRISRSSILESPSIKLATSPPVSAGAKHSIRLNFSMPFPPRVPFQKETSKYFSELEKKVFDRWKENKEGLFEQNIETWRQFWLVCERSDVIVQIVDARNPDFFVVREIMKQYENKRHVIFMNKCDLLVDEQNKYEINKHEEAEDDCKENELVNINIKDSDNSINKDTPIEMVEFNSSLSNLNLKNKTKLGNEELEEFEIVRYSSKKNIDDPFNIEINAFIDTINGKTVGLIGYPNVGKSSTVNLLLESKKVQVSEVPGKTKHIQSYFVDDSYLLLDCPGLVFYGKDKLNLILNGIVNVNQIVNYKEFADDVYDKIGRENVKKYNFMKREYEMFKKIVNDNFSGNLKK